VRCSISLVFFILKLGKIVIVKEGKLSINLESFFFLVKSIIDKHPGPTLLEVFLFSAHITI
jgi:hypothetical protein